MKNADFVAHENLINFLISQLRLMLMNSHQYRCDSDLIVSSFLWKMTSFALYNKLSSFFILPSTRRLQQLSSGFNEHLSPSDGTLIYYISGCIGRSVARVRKCDKCKTLLIDTNSDQDFKEHCDLKQDYSELFELLSRGGLARPSALNFGIW